MLLYHGTTEENARLIIDRGGIRPRSSQYFRYPRKNPPFPHHSITHDKCVYLSRNYGPFFAANASGLKEHNWAIIEIDISLLDSRCLMPSEDYLAGFMSPPLYGIISYSSRDRTRWYHEKLTEYQNHWYNSVVQSGCMCHWGTIPIDAVTRIAVFEPLSNWLIVMQAMRIRPGIAPSSFLKPEVVTAWFMGRDMKIIEYYDVYWQMVTTDAGLTYAEFFDSYWGTPLSGVDWLRDVDTGLVSNMADKHSLNWNRLEDILNRRNGWRLIHEKSKETTQSGVYHVKAVGQTVGHQDNKPIGDRVSDDMREKIQALVEEWVFKVIMPETAIASMSCNEPLILSDGIYSLFLVEVNVESVMPSQRDDTVWCSCILNGAWDIVSFKKGIFTKADFTLRFVEHLMKVSLEPVSKLIESPEDRQVKAGAIADIRFIIENLRDQATGEIEDRVVTIRDAVIFNHDYGDVPSGVLGWAPDKKREAKERYLREMLEHIDKYWLTEVSLKGVSAALGNLIMDGTRI